MQLWSRVGAFGKPSIEVAKKENFSLIAALLCSRSLALPLCQATRSPGSAAEPQVEWRFGSEGHDFEGRVFPASAPFEYSGTCHPNCMQKNSLGNKTVGE